MYTTQTKTLKVGDLLSETQYYQVVGIDAMGGGIDVKNERGFKFHIAGNIIEEGTFAANQIREEVAVTKTELAQRLLALDSTIFEVSYQKQPDEKTINEALSKVNRGNIMTNETIKATVKEAYKGETRILRGYKIGNEPEFGRIKVVDLDTKLSDKSIDSGIRLVDLRTVNYLVYKGVKYNLKK